MDDGRPLDAGAFGTWMGTIRRALRREAEADVPCGGCTACCSSSQFVHIGPDERDALAHIPEALRFPAPGRPEGHVLMGYDEHGRCPMLGATGCTIYEHRPRTCRTYDCRVFAASGVEPDRDQPAVAARVARWRFDHEDGAARALHDACRAAAAFVRDAGSALGDDAPRHPTALAVAAVEVADLFVGGEPTVAEVRVRLRQAGEVSGSGARRPSTRGRRRRGGGGTG